MIPIVVLAGTRPEVIKLAPVYLELQKRGATVELWLTGQHTSLAQGPVEFFGLKPTVTWDTLVPGQSSNLLLSKLLLLLDEHIARSRPAALIVQGDTTTALAGGIAAFHRRVPVAHVEAGLRSGDLDAPFPEEMNRRAIDALSRWRFPPTVQAARVLKAEGHGDLSPPTGNTGIDALHWARRRVRESTHWPSAVPRIGRKTRLVLSTGHRRENLGGPLEGILRVLAQEIAVHEDVTLIHVAHPNPQANSDARRALEGRPRSHVVEALNYPDFVALLDRADVVVTDSGGIQEEGPSLGLPILITREVTERPEVLKCGGKLVGTDPLRLVQELRKALRKAKPRTAGVTTRLRRTPFGDGRASERIVARILRDLY